MAIRHIKVHVTTANRRLSCCVTIKPMQPNTQNQIRNGSSAASGVGPSPDQSGFSVVLTSRVL